MKRGGKTGAKTKEASGRPVEPFDLLKAVKLRMEKNLSYKDIAKIVGVSPQSVQERMARLGTAFNDPERLELLKEHEPIMIDGIRAMVLERMSTVLGNEKSNISFSQLALGYGIMLDKARLLRGQSTTALQQLTALIHAAHRLKDQDKDSEQSHSDKAIDITPGGGAGITPSDTTQEAELGGVGTVA